MMRLERLAIATSLILGLIAIVLGMLVASSRPARAQDDSTALYEIPGRGENPILRDSVSPATAKPDTPPNSGDGLAGLQKGTVRPGGHLPQSESGLASPEAFVNGDFESGPGWPWIEASAHGWPLILHTTSPRDGLTLPGGLPPHSGDWAVWLGGDHDEVAFIRQAVSIPASRVTLGFWMWIASDDFCGYDFGGVIVHDTMVVDVFPLCDAWNTGQWVKREVKFTTCSAQTIPFQIRAETDGTLNSNLFIDDVTLNVEPIVCSRVYLPLVTRQTAGPPPDPYAPPCDASNNNCEPYNSCLTAYGPLRPGRAYSAYPNDRNDYHFLELSGPASVSIQVTNYREEGQLILRDPNDLQNPLGFDFETPGGDGVMNVSKSNLPAGRYCVQVFTADGHYQNSNRYTLTLAD